MNVKLEFGVFPVTDVIDMIKRKFIVRYMTSMGRQSLRCAKTFRRRKIRWGTIDGEGRVYFVTPDSRPHTQFINRLLSKPYTHLLLGKAIVPSVDRTLQTRLDRGDVDTYFVMCR